MNRPHKPTTDPPGKTQTRSRWRWWAVGLAGVTGLALTTVGTPATSAANTAGRNLTTVDDQPSTGNHRDKSGKGEKEKKPPGTPVPCDADALIAAITLANARGGATLNPVVFIDDAGLPAITTPITLNGGKHTTITRAAAVEQFRILTVNTGGDLTLNHLTITGGQTDSDGGGILVNTGGALTTNHSTITRNIAADNGGGIANNGTTTVTHSTVSRNTASDSGGGIHSLGLLKVRESHVDANIANAGGGIFESGSTVTVKGGSISGNQAGTTGGLFVFGANGVVTGTKITGNTSSGSGTGVRVDNTAQLTMRHVNVSDNTSDISGGGLFVGEGDNFAVVEDSLLKNNTATFTGGGIFNSGETVLRRTKVIGNQADVGGGIQNFGTISLFTTKVLKNIAITTGGGILNSGGTVNLNTATGTVVIKNRPNNCVNVPGCAG